MNFTESHKVILQVFTYKETDYILAPPTKITHTPNEQIKGDKNTNCMPKLRKSVLTRFNSLVRNNFKDDPYCPKNMNQNINMLSILIYYRSIFKIMKKVFVKLLCHTV